MVLGYLNKILHHESSLSANPNRLKIHFLFLSGSQMSLTDFWFLCFCKQNRYNQAKLSIHDRALKVAAVVESLEREMELLCLTGVEDQLQADVRPTLEMLRNAGIKVPLAHFQRAISITF